MPNCITVSLGGIPIQLVPDQLQGDYELVGRTADFYTTDPAELSLHVCCGWFPDLNVDQIAFETVHAWQLIKTDGKFGIKANTHYQDPYLLGIFPPDFRSGDIYVARHIDHSDKFIFPLSHPMGELYLMSLLGTGLGMLIHAAGVIDQRRGYLFTGHGGAGKTTTAKLWQGLPGVQVVNDDKVILRKLGDKFHIFGTPWHGQGGMTSPDSAPLEKVFILKQANDNYTSMLHPAQAASLILARAFSPLWDSEKTAFSLEFLEELCQSVPCYELGFLPDKSVVEFVRNIS